MISNVFIMDVLEKEMSNTGLIYLYEDQENYMSAYSISALRLLSLFSDLEKETVFISDNFIKITKVRISKERVMNINPDYYVTDGSSIIINPRWK